MKNIPLTQGKVALVDDEDYDALKDFPWFAIKQRHHWYAVYSTGPASARVQHRMHTIIMNAPQGMEVDHRSGDGLDNRRDNLRIATQEQNAKNRRKIKVGTSAFKGVNWFPYNGGKWLARITVDHRTICVGYFKDEVAAAKAYDSAAKQHHGAFARPNFA